MSSALNMTREQLEQYAKQDPDGLLWLAEAEFGLKADPEVLAADPEGGKQSELKKIIDAIVEKAEADGQTAEPAGDSSSDEPKEKKPKPVKVPKEKKPKLSKEPRELKRAPLDSVVPREKDVARWSKHEKPFGKGDKPNLYLAIFDLLSTGTVPSDPAGLKAAVVEMVAVKFPDRKSGVDYAIYDTFKCMRERGWTWTTEDGCYKISRLPN